MAPKSPTFKVFYAISFAWQLGFLIIFPILGFGFLGGLADSFFKTHGLFTLVGFLTGVAVAIYETINMIVPLITGKK